VRIKIKRIHGIDIKDASSIKEINSSLEKKYKNGIYREVLYELGKIDCILTNWDWDEGFPREEYPNFIKGVRNMDNLVLLLSLEDIYQIENQYGHSIRGLDDFELMLESYYLS